MKPHLLIAVDAFAEKHIRAVAESIVDWATWERMPETASAAEYGIGLARAEMMIGWPEPSWLLPSPIKLLLCPSAGYDSYLNQGLDVKQDFIFCNASGIYSEGVAEHCLAMMMALTRRLPQYVRAMQTRIWHQLSRHDELMGAGVCIVGMGGIGMAIAWRCAALGMVVTGVRRDPQYVTEVCQKMYAPNQLREAVADADHVICTLPGGTATAGLFNYEIFDAMKPGAYFYNVGRGSVVDEKELVKRLQSGQLAGAGLDVFAAEPLPENSPLWTLDNVIVTPHMAGLTADYADQLCDLFITNLRLYHEGKPLLNVIDLGGHRS